MAVHDSGGYWYHSSQPIYSWHWTVLEHITPVQLAGYTDAKTDAVPTNLNSKFCRLALFHW